MLSSWGGPDASRAQTWGSFWLGLRAEVEELLRVQEQFPRFLVRDVAVQGVFDELWQEGCEFRGWQGGSSAFPAGMGRGEAELGLPQCPSTGSCSVPLQSNHPYSR